MTHQDLKPERVAALLAGKPAWTFVDVRTVEEFEQGHVPGAYNVPIMLRGAGGMVPNPKFLPVMKAAFARDARLVCACKGGGRSTRACELLADQGYAELGNLLGGMLGKVDEDGRTEPGWSGSGLATERTSAPERTWTELEKRSAR